MTMRAKSKKKDLLESSEADEFLSGAKYADLAEEENIHPWKSKNLDHNKIRRLTVKLPEEYALKLDFLTKNSIPKTSKQRYILDVLIPLIDKELKKKGIG